MNIISIKILGVHQKATQTEITQAYDDLIRQYPSEQNMNAYIILENAFNTLSDEAQRRTYDLSLAKRVIRETNVVNSSTMSRRDAEKLAEDNRAIVLRYSNTYPGEIAMTVLNSENKPEHLLLSNILINDMIKNRQADFSTPEKAIESLERIFSPYTILIPHLQNSADYRTKLSAIKKESNPIQEEDRQPPYKTSSPI